MGGGEQKTVRPIFLAFQAIWNTFHFLPVEAKTDLSGWVAGGGWVDGGKVRIKLSKSSLSWGLD